MLTPFRTRTGIEPEVELEGELDEISQSQRMALLSVFGEALNNIREHSGATRVTISIVSDESGVRARVLDDGRGFDVEEELLRAARRGHMGLAGVYERVRLLGGHCRIESRPGGPSEIAIALPRWQAAGDRARRRQAPGGGAQAPSPSEAVLEGVADGAAAVADAELAVDVREVELDRVLGHPQLGADRLGRLAARDRSEDRRLARGQLRALAVSGDGLGGAVEERVAGGDLPHQRGDVQRAHALQHVRAGAGLARRSRSSRGPRSPTGRWS